MFCIAIPLILSAILCYIFHSFLKKCVHRVKYWAAYEWEWIRRKRSERTIPFDHKSKDPGRYGFSCPPEAVKIELPRSLQADLRAIDGVEFAGVDNKGNTLKLRLLRRSDEKADVWLYLHTVDGPVYQLPHQPFSTERLGSNPRAFSAAGLLIEVLDPLRCWRVVYNGFLKTASCDGQSKDKTIVAQFNFVWRPFFNHLAFPDDFSVPFQAKYLADQDWTKEFRLPANRFCEERLEQFGQLYGTITFEDQKPQEWLIRGIKSRRYGKIDWENVLGRLSIQGITENGVAFHLFGDVSKDFHKNFIYGYILPSSNMAVYHVNNCDLNCFQLIECKETHWDKLQITISADGHPYHLQLHKRENDFHVYENSFSKIKVNVWDIDITLNSDKGRGLIEISKPNHDYYGKAPTKSWEFHQRSSAREPNTKDFDGLVVNFGEIECLSAKLVGGKCSSLATLLQLRRDGLDQFNVPSGLAVTRIAFEQFLKSNPEVKSAINHVQNIAWQKVKGSIEQECQKLMTLIEGLKVSVELENELNRSLKNSFGSDWENKRFAVRSSGIGIEDGEETSAAGQNETYLGVEGLEQICSSIVKCWGSQFSHRSIEYKRQNGQLLNEGMGVAVQEMVPADVAGVLFTRDPVEGNISRIVVTCNYGLGESVVSGATDPDTIILSRTFEGQAAIHNKTLGGKASAIKMKESGGTEEYDLDSSTSDQFSLSDDDALRLGKLAIAIEEYFGSPRDIEWALSNGDIFLLQVRPVTTGYEPSEFEILHEFDTGLRTDGEHYTTGNVGEVMPGYTHPLSLCTSIRAFENSMQISLTWKCLTHRYDPTHTDIFPCQYGRMMLDRLQQKSWQLEEKKGTISKAMEVAIYGRVLDDDDVKDKAIIRYGVPPRLSQFNFTISAIKGIFFGNKRNKQNMVTTWDLPSSAEGAIDAQDAHQRILHRNYGMISLAENHIDVSFASCVWNMLLFSLLANSEELTTENYQDFATLIGGCNDVESGNVPASLQELADEIVKSNPEFSKMSLEDSLKWLQSDENTSGKLYKQFLRRHGHRCRYEFDLARIPWNEDELNLISILKDIVNMSSGSIKPKEDKVVEDPFQHINAKFTPFWKKLVRYLYKLCQDGIRNRELSKSVTIKYVDGMRKSYRDLGRMMVKEGVLPEDRLIYFLNDWEISQLLKYRSPAIIRRAKHRRRRHMYMEDLKFPEMIDGRFFPPDESKTAETNGVGVKVVKGFPVCKGIITARACVIISFSQCHEIKEGDVLITHSTDIAWSPYFPLLSGVVTQIGGLVSHGAVVAREFGLPCIVGAFDATKVFHTGDTVTLDANSGFIMKISS